MLRCTTSIAVCLVCKLDELGELPVVINGGVLVLLAKFSTEAFVFWLITLER